MGAHHHHHHHKAHAAPQSLNAAFGIAVFLNTGFVIFQIMAALHAGSMGLLADAVHNAGDVFGLMLAWGANWLLTLPARRRYSYGYKRMSIIAAMMNALMLAAGSALIAVESIQKLRHLSDLKAEYIIGVALAGILINGGTALLFWRGSGDDLNIKGAFLHLAADAVISLGVVIAGVLILLTGKMWIDPVTGLLIVLIVLWGTYGLLRDSVRLILDGIPRHIDHEGIRHYLMSLPGVTAIHDLHIWGLSTRESALTAHLVMPDKKLSDEDYRAINLFLKQKFKIDHATLQTETGDLQFPCHTTEYC